MDGSAADGPPSPATRFAQRLGVVACDTATEPGSSSVAASCTIWHLMRGPNKTCPQSATTHEATNTTSQVGMQVGDTAIHHIKTHIQCSAGRAHTTRAALWSLCYLIVCYGR